MKVTLPPGCMGLEAPGGVVRADKSYRDRVSHGPQLGSPSKRRDRTADITDSAELEMVKRNPYLNTPAVYFAGEGWECPGCHFGNWAWSAACTRCQTDRPAAVAASHPEGA